MVDSQKSEAVLTFFQTSIEHSLFQFLQNFNWDINIGRVVRVLTDNINSEDIQYFSDQLGDLAHKKDWRTPPEYAAELIRGWLVEDIVYTILNRHPKISVSHKGADMSRDFLQETTADSDLTGTISGSVIDIEIVSDFTEFWSQNNAIDLRQSKYNELSNNVNRYLLGVDIINNTFCFVNPTNTETTTFETHPVWEKPATRIYISDTFISLDDIASVVVDTVTDAENID
jgi:uncharacterized membrane-anchored protein YjiN (DUF445 family)